MNAIVMGNKQLHDIKLKNSMNDKRGWSWFIDGMSNPRNGFLIL